MKKISIKITQSSFFESFIMLTILVNCILIGVETYFTNSLILTIQSIALAIFVLEIILRYSASITSKAYFSQGWNIFDLSIVLISLVPESLFTDSSTISAIRVLRVFRVLRLLRVNDEIKLIISVLVKSCSALFYNAIFFFIFLYLYSIIGVTLFKVDSLIVDELSVKYKESNIENVIFINEMADNDPYRSLDETMFTLFRILTGDDWSEIRYNLNEGSEIQLITSSKTVIAIYHVTWVILSSFLLLNLVVGAILNNYDVVMKEMKRNEKENI